MKIFGIGLSRTGTKSLSAALEILGYKIAHYPCDVKTFRELSSGQYRLSILNSRDGITDITTIPFFPHFDRLYPRSRFILTLRSRESWLASMEKHTAANPLSYFIPDFLAERKMQRFLRAAVYGSYTFDRERYTHVFKMHHKRVHDYFAAEPGKLLVMDIPAGEGWGKLCPFLGKPVPAVPFPHVK